jgi:tetratricopeptide (TPR) repeat protein/CHAT domain-containing protein
MHYSLGAQTNFPSLKQQFLDFRKADNQDSALFTARMMNQLALKEQSDTSYWYALSLRYIGNPFETEGNNDSTLFYWLKSLHCFEKYHEYSDDHAIGYSSLGNYYRKLGQYKIAEDYYLKAKEIRIKQGTNSTRYALALNNLSVLYNAMGYYDKAMQLVDSSMNIHSRIYANDSTHFVPELHSKAEILMNIGDFKGSELLYHYCISFCNNSNCSLERRMRYSRDLAEVYIKSGKYESAQKVLFEIDSSLSSISRNKDEQVLYGDVKYRLGMLYSIMGQYTEAQEFYIESLDIKLSILPKNNPEIAQIYNSAGILQKKLGNIETAKNYYQEAIQIRKNSLGELHPDYAESLNSLASLLLEIGDYRNAELFSLKALHIRQNALGEDHISYTINLNTLGRIYRITGEYDKAEKYYKQSLEIRLKIYGDENHYRIAQGYNGLGHLYLLMGRYGDAEYCLLKALKIINSIALYYNTDYALIQYNLGWLYYLMDDFKKSEDYLLQSIEIRKKLFGDYNDELISSELAYGKLFLKQGKWENAISILDSVFKKQSKLVMDNFQWLNENQKEDYWKKAQVFYETISFLANRYSSNVPELSALNFNSSLISKSRLLESNISNENYYRDIDELRDRLLTNRRLIAKAESEGTEQNDALLSLKRESDSLDYRLLKLWPAYAQQKRNLTITWEEVQLNLNSDEAAIEFVRFKNETDSLYYYNALVVKKGDLRPTLVRLCKEKELVSISPKLGCSAYYNLIWQPIEPVLNGIKTIYYAPTGELYNVPFHAIYSPKSNGDDVIASKSDKRGIIVQSEMVSTEQSAEYLMDRYSMHQLTSTRYLAMGLKEKEKEKIGSSITLVGGINYDFLPGEQSAKKKGKKQTSLNRTGQSALEKLAYLEGTKTEMLTVKDSISSKNWKYEILDSDKATEENLIRQEGKHAKSILHIATHGYAFPAYNFSDTTTISENALRYSYRYSSNPMVQSGLILAGGNWAWTGSDTLTKLGAEQNGILTALEVSQLNLKKTKLVVLSACETGLGKIEGSEGTFGLKRGFKLAGVEQMIVSLWSVPDKETMELMTLFYSDLTKTLNPVQSFEKAQKQMRNQYPTQPDKWAGFVLVR